jgi:peptide subunit release factor 1 (eRF1)
MDDIEKKKQELEEVVKVLEGIRGSHTELVTVLIPEGANIYQVAGQLAAERSTAENIKSKQTRTAVTDALDMIVRELKKYKQTPKNGLALYCGNISEKEGNQDIHIWALELPRPLRVRIYRCDKEFVIEPLKEMLAVQEVYGLLAIDRQEATIGLLEGKKIEVIRKIESSVPGKYKAGGQCLAPDTVVETKDGQKMLSDIKIGDEIKALDIKSNKTIFTKCLNIWKKEKRKYIQIDLSDMWEIISSEDHIFFKKDTKKSITEVSAKNLAVEDQLIKDGMVKEISILRINKFNKKISLIDIETEQGNFFANNILVHNSAQRFERIREDMAKAFFKEVAEGMKNIFFEMPKLKGILIGGPMPTKDEFIRDGDLPTKLKEKIIAVKDMGYTGEHGLKLLVEASQEDIAEQEFIKEKNLLTKFFETLGKNPGKAVYGFEKTKLALERGAVELLLISKDVPKELAMELEKSAENAGSNVEIISLDNQDGEQFLNLTKGIGGILRFQIDFSEHQ